jgi:photosystem II stability/assembly factor-like uncharacterized protein
LKTVGLLIASLLFSSQISNKLMATDPVPWELVMQWQPCKANLRAVHAFDSQHVWIGGSQGTILATDDGGVNWRDISPASHAKSEFRSLWSLGPKTAVAATAGQPAVILRTEDGGDSWSEVFRSNAEETFFNGLRFVDPLRGMAFSDPVNGRLLILRTVDGGKSWQPIASDSIPAAEPGEAGFAASNSGLTLFKLDSSRGEGTAPPIVVWIGLGGSTEGASRLFHSHNFGDTWKIAMVDPIQRNASSGIFALALMNPQRGIAVGGDYTRESGAQSHIAITEDGGLHWRLPKGTPPRGFRSGLVYVTAVGFICVGPTGCEASVDGEDWEKVSDVGYHAVVADDVQGLWCVGSDGRVAHFTRTFSKLE